MANLDVREERCNKKVSSGGPLQLGTFRNQLPIVFSNPPNCVAHPPIPLVTLPDKDTQRMRPGWSWQKQIYKSKENGRTGISSIKYGFMIYFFTIGTHFPCSDVLIGISWTVDSASGYTGCANARLSELSQEKICLTHVSDKILLT